jgi:phosphoglycerate dehydrogenase-like enzyme
MQRIIGIRASEVTEKQKEIIRQTAPGFEILDLTRGYTTEQIAECEIIFGNIAPEDMAHAKKLKWKHTQYAGVEAYCKPGVATPQLFTNAAGAYGIAISEHLMTMAMTLQRRMDRYIKNMQNREWKYLGKVQSVYGSLVVVVGLGDIGGCFAERMHALGADIKVITRNERWGFPSYISEACISSNKEQTDIMLSQADIIALCMPHTSETVNFINAERIKKLKSGVIILNAGRGSAIDEEALADGLESGHIGGAGLDVTTVEPLPSNSRLWDCPNIIITPHVSGGSSLDFTFKLIFDKFIKYLDDYINGRSFEVTVDTEAGY